MPSSNRNLSPGSRQRGLGREIVNNSGYGYMSSSFELEAQKLKLSSFPARIKPIN